MKFYQKKNYETILYPACYSGEIELVKYLISLDKIDIESQSIFFFLVFKRN